MIDAKELRLGNWLINEHGREYQVDGHEIYQFDAMPEYRELWQPIPLTPEVLEACEGFTKYEWFEGYFKKTKFGDFMIRLYEGEIHCFFTNITYDNMGMKFSGKRYIGNLNATQNIIYLHQLQNFLAICGQELEYKPKV